jgi:hypothetical protein
MRLSFPLIKDSSGYVVASGGELGKARAEGGRMWLPLTVRFTAVRYRPWDRPLAWLLVAYAVTRGIRRA